MFDSTDVLGYSDWDCYDVPEVVEADPGDVHAMLADGPRLPLAGPALDEAAAREAAVRRVWTEGNLR